MNKEGMNELKKLFEQKQKKDSNNSSSKNKKKETKEDKKKQEKQEKFKKENTKQDFSLRAHTLTGNELESVRNNLVKNVNKNDKNVKASNNTNKEPMNELDKIKSNLARKSVILTTTLDIKIDNNNGGVKNAIQNFNKPVNENKDNKKEANKAKNIISNINKDNNKNGNNKDEKNEIKNVKTNVSNINNKNGNNKDEKNEIKNVKTNATNINNKENKNNIPKSKTETVIDPENISSVLKDNGKMDIKSLIKTNNKTINENEKKVCEKSFDRFVSLQTLLKKESSLKELCK